MPGGKSYLEYEWRVCVSFTDALVLLLVFCSVFCQRFLDNPRANLRQVLHAGVLWFRMCLLPFWGLAVPGGRKKGEMKFLLLWESMGNFCILAVLSDISATLAQIHTK